jgi:hypothetical protein
MMMIAEIQEVCSMSFFYGGSKSAFSIYSWQAPTVEEEEEGAILLVLLAPLSLFVSVCFPASIIYRGSFCSFPFFCPVVLVFGLLCNIHVCKYQTVFCRVGGVETRSFKENVFQGEHCAMLFIKDLLEIVSMFF